MTLYPALSHSHPVGSSADLRLSHRLTQTRGPRVLSQRIVPQVLPIHSLPGDSLAGLRLSHRLTQTREPRAHSQRIVPQVLPIHSLPGDSSADLRLSHRLTQTREPRARSIPEVLRDHRRQSRRYRIARRVTRAVPGHPEERDQQGEPEILRRVHPEAYQGVITWLSIAHCIRN